MLKTGLGLSKISDLFDSKEEKTWKFSRTCSQVFRNSMKDTKSNYQRLATVFSRLQHLVTEPRSQHLGNMTKKLRSWVYLILYKKYISGKKFHLPILYISFNCIRFLCLKTVYFWWRKFLVAIRLYVKNQQVRFKSIQPSLLKPECFRYE